LVDTEWPWTAVVSHDDDRSKIADALPESWDDVTSEYTSGGSISSCRGICPSQINILGKVYVDIYADG